MNRILYNEDGVTIDEIVYHGYVHLEQMTDDLYWMGVGDSHFFLRAVKRGQLDVTCPDGPEDHDFPLVQRHKTQAEVDAQGWEPAYVTQRGQDDETPEQVVATVLAIQRRVEGSLTRQSGRCDGFMLRGPNQGRRCPYRATGYQRTYDLRLCGYHQRAYLSIEPLP